MYEWIAIDPEEVRGQIRCHHRFLRTDEHPEDTWYTPTVRKVRRLAGAVSKQFFPGTIVRYEDVSHVRALPDLDYKIVGIRTIQRGSRRYMAMGPQTIQRLNGSMELVM